MFESKKELVRDNYRFRLDLFRLVDRLCPVEVDNQGKYYNNVQSSAFYNTFKLLGFNDGKIYKKDFEKAYTKAENDLYKCL